MPLPQGDWTRVDEAEDPLAFVRWLDASRQATLKLAEANPGQFFSHLSPHLGDTMLEVGCGTGDLLHPLARLVGPTGRVVGVDNSTTMVGEAQRRLADTVLPVEIILGDGSHLDFPDASFDVCFATALLAHLRDPGAAVKEMARVVRGGGRVALTEHDWGTYAIEASDRGLTRRILQSNCDDQIRQGWIGRQLPGFCVAAGLEVREVAAHARVLRRWDLVCDDIRQMAVDAAGRGAVTQDEATRWFADVESRARMGAFVGTITTFRVTASKPV